MRILYLDCLSGISGDMTVGALCDLGVESRMVDEALATLNLGAEFHAHYSRQHRQNIEGIKFDVHAHAHHGDGHHHHHHGDTHNHGSHSHEEHAHGRNFRQIRELLEKSALSEFVKMRSAAIFRRIAEAEGKIHGMPAEDVAFHEVGAIDSIVDIVGACVALEALKVDQIVASPLFEGSGWITCAHGRFPLPAPATLEILKGIPLRQIDEAQEFITPTGAAILAEFAVRYAPLPNIRVEKIGYGIGTRNIPSRPNVLRAIIGELTESDDSEADEILQMETNLDDISSEILSHAAEKLRNAGALDVFVTPVLMKKNRPAFLLTILCEPQNAASLENIVFTETTAFGLRKMAVKRTKLRREIREVSTRWGAVRVKFGYRKDMLVQASPEFESCREISERKGISLDEIYRAAIAAAR